MILTGGKLGGVNLGVVERVELLLELLVLVSKVLGVGLGELFERVVHGHLSAVGKSVKLRDKRPPLHALGLAVDGDLADDCRAPNKGGQRRGRAEE